ncbi:MAG: hypothetical protein IT445_11850 [Phycisphaeraceae bacterium]|nr:hypothetical protein [Phycisphaeraceae bacterium]
MRDRWLEKVAAEPTLLAASSSGGKYDVSRMLESPGAVDVTRRFEAA